MNPVDKSRRLSARRQPGRASDYLLHLPDALARYPGRPTVLLCRVSTDEQAADGNLDDQIIDALRALRAEGVRPIGVFDGVETSRINGNRVILEQAIAYAQEHNAILVAMDRSRLIRASSFGRGQTMKAEPPANHEYEELARMADGMPLATIMDPDATDVRSEQIKRGQRAKGNRGGRPPNTKPGEKKRRREELRPCALKLRGDGLSWREIELAIGVAESTVRGWL